MIKPHARCFMHRTIVSVGHWHNWGSLQKHRCSDIITETYSDIIMGAMASQITSLTIVYSTLYSGTDQRKYQSSASLASVRGIHRWPVNSPHKGPVTRKMFSFDDVIMGTEKGVPTLYKKCKVFEICIDTLTVLLPYSVWNSKTIGPIKRDIARVGLRMSFGRIFVISI